MPFASSISRSRPRRVADEKDTLVGWLDYHRATLLTKLEGSTTSNFGGAWCLPESACWVS